MIAISPRDAEGTVALQVSAGLSAHQTDLVRLYLDGLGFKLLATDHSEISRVKMRLYVPLTVSSIVVVVSKDKGIRTSKDLVIATVSHLSATLKSLFKDLALDKSEVAPKDELWIKIGVDKGGHYNKVSFQPMNAPLHNSVKNTYTMGMYEGEESYEEMKAAFGGFDASLFEITQLGLELQGKVLRVKFFLCADMKALQAMLGLSQGGSFFCPYCEACDLHLSHRGQHQRKGPSRTIEGLLSNLASFREAGGSLESRSKANKYKNVIFDPLFTSIPIENVAIPILHIDLGVFKKIVDTYEDGLALAERWYFIEVEKPQDNIDFSFRSSDESYLAVVQDVRRLLKEINVLSANLEEKLSKSTSCRLMQQHFMNMATARRIPTVWLRGALRRQKLPAQS